MQSVVSAFELQDFLAIRGGARDAASVHRDFRAARAEAHHLDGIAFADFFRKLPFHVVRHAEGRSFMQLLLDGLHHRGMAMPGHQCAEAQVVIDVFVSIDVVNLASLPVLHKQRIGLVVAVVAGNAERDALQCALVRVRGFRRALFVCGDFLL